MNIDFRQWQYYLSLEQDFQKTLRFVELDVENFDSYSIEFSKLLLLIGAEFESVCKELINSVAPEVKTGNIGNIKGGLLQEFPKICLNEVRVVKYKLSFCPFENWDNGEELTWWNSYNSLKHNRFTNFKHANLKSVLYSIGALLIVLIYLYKFRDNYKHLVSNNEFFEANGMGEILIAAPSREITDNDRNYKP